MGFQNLVRSGWKGIRMYPFFWVSSLLIALGMMSLEDPKLFGEDFHQLFTHHFIFLITVLIASFWVHLREQFTKRRYSLWFAVFLIATFSDWLIYPFSEINYPAAGGVSILMILLSIMAFGLYQLPQHQIQANHSLLQVVIQLIISSVYAQIIFLGIVLAIAGINLLFDLDLSEDLYFRLAVICFLPLNAAILSGNLSDFQAEEINAKPHFLIKRLFQYVLIPLTALYVLITLSYLFKNFFGNDSDSFVVTWLSLGYLSFGLLTFSVGQLFEQDEEMSWWNVKKQRILMALMAIVWIGLVGGIFGRIGEYGYTINRYLLLLFGLWMGSTIVLLLYRPKAFKEWLITLGVFCLIGTFGPLSINSVPIKSQLKRLESYFPQGDETSKRNVLIEYDQEAKAEMLDILTYLSRDHDSNEALTNFFGLDSLASDERSLARLQNILQATGLEYLQEQEIKTSEEILIAGIYLYEQVGPNTHLTDWIELQKDTENRIELLRNDSKSASIEWTDDLSTIKVVQQSDGKLLLEKSFLPSFEQALLEHALEIERSAENKAFRHHIESDNIRLDFNFSWVRLNDQRIEGLTTRILVSWK